MCVKLPLGDLNPDLYPLHPTSTYTCRVTNTPKMCGGIFVQIFRSKWSFFLRKKNYEEVSEVWNDNNLAIKKQQIANKIVIVEL